MKRNQTGFTLIELMIVVGIIGILSAIAVPTYQSFQKSSAEKACLAEASAYVRSQLAKQALNPGTEFDAPEESACESTEKFSVIAADGENVAQITAKPESPGTLNIICRTDTGNCSFDVQ